MMTDFAKYKAHLSQQIVHQLLEESVIGTESAELTLAEGAHSSRVAATLCRAATSIVGGNASGAYDYVCLLALAIAALVNASGACLASAHSGAWKETASGE
jgi:hypothetical protein